VHIPSKIRPIQRDQQIVSSRRRRARPASQKLVQNEARIREVTIDLLDSVLEMLAPLQGERSAQGSDSSSAAAQGRQDDRRQKAHALYVQLFEEPDDELLNGRKRHSSAVITPARPQKPRPK
jgi:hypothetical protein